MSMSKKDFIALADYVRLHNKYVSSPDTEFNAGHLKVLADFCKAQNDNFLRERWLSYIAGECGPNGGAL
jgi:hypothetical protein